MTLAERLSQLHPGASRRSVKQWIESGRVTVNGQAARDSRALVSESDRVTLGSARQGERRAAALGGGLRLVHEDAALLVIDKPAGLLTIATEREKGRTAYRLVWDYLAGRRPPARPFIVHRLDRDTSGLIAIATTPEAKQQLQAQFAARTAKREYVAVVEGAVRENAGTLTSLLVEDRDLRVRARADGVEAITHYRVLTRRRDTTTLALTLGTGRRHQIRVQLADAGHPIAGDRAHGGHRDPFGRLALHACRLGLVHPVTGETVTFESAPPSGWV